MTRLTLILTVICALISSSAQADDHQLESDEDRIKEAYATYADNFMTSDFAAVADKFTYPVSFKINNLPFVPSSITLHDPEEMIEFYKSLRENIQEGYSYSTVDRISLEKTQEGYVADVIYSRFNAKDELLIEGRGFYFYREVDGHWKMYAVEVPED